jgi:hypothetical protein
MLLLFITRIKNKTYFWNSTSINFLG